MPETISVRKSSANATSGGNKRQPQRKRRRRSQKKYLTGSLRKRLSRALWVALALVVFAPSLKLYFGESDQTIAANKPVTIPPPFKLTEEDTGLEKELKALNTISTNKPGVFAIQLDSGRYINLNGKHSYSAASMIKMPILVAFLVACELNEVSMDDILEITDKVKTTGSGFLQWRKSGTKLSAKRTAELMMIVSDNTATNMIIDHLGGKEGLNKKFHQWKLDHTKINNYLIDIEGTNQTTPYDLVYLLGRVESGELINEDSRKFMYRVMKKCRNRSLLPRGLKPGAEIIHKTGTLGMMIGDAGIVTTKNGVKYAVAVQVERKRNDRRANALIRKMSEKIYSAFESSDKKK